MYDRIILKLDWESLPAGYSWQKVLERIVPLSYRTDGIGGTGRWRGYKGKVTATESYVKFEGSLPKCLYGHNTRTLSLREVKQTIILLSHDLGVPMYKATVIEAEFAHNFSMEETPVLYQRKLDAMKKFSSNEWSGTKYIDNGKVRIKFYDKKKDAKKKKELPKVGRSSLPDNLLRYEVTFTRDALNDLFDRNITANELYSKYVFWTLFAEWFGYYEDIIKLPNDCLDVEFDNFKSAKDFDRWCICIANEVQNMAYYMKQVIFKNRKNRLDKDRILHSQIQKRIQEAMNWQKEYLKTSPLMEELTDKVVQYLTHRLEVSDDGMTIEEEQKIFWQAN